MIRYKRLGYVALNTSDLTASKRFYNEVVGLTVSGETSEWVSFRCSSQHHDVMLYKGGKPGLKRLGFCIESEAALRDAVAFLCDSGLAVSEIPAAESVALQQGPTFRFVEPNTGIQMEFYADMMQFEDFEPLHTKIARLGHVVLGVAEFDKALRYFQEVLNFRVSDFMGDGTAFMRCFPNPYHHSVALGRAQENSLHHVNFMVSDIDDIGIARNRLLDREVPIVFGPGRHFPSTSIFLYFLDPDGITLEYSFGMEEFPEQGARDPRALPFALEILDIWGGRPDPKMGRVGFIEPAGSAAPAV
jgi:2,3-dihydroxy-p-cumate/2,3-dihydroxybenzoate 3,4-dioxygenase